MNKEMSLRQEVLYRNLLRFCGSPEKVNDFLRVLKSVQNLPKVDRIRILTDWDNGK